MYSPGRVPYLIFFVKMGLDLFLNIIKEYVGLKRHLQYVQETYRLYGVLWWTGDHKCTESVLVLYYRHELTFYD